MSASVFVGISALPTNVTDGVDVIMRGMACLNQRTLHVPVFTLTPTLYGARNFFTTRQRSDVQHPDRGQRNGERQLG